MHQQKPSLGALPQRKPSQLSMASVQSQRSTQIKSPSSSGNTFNSQSPNFKQFHVHKNSNVDITSLAKLITNQKVEMQKPPPSLSNTQITAMLQRAKEISANFKNLSPTQSQRNNRAQHTKQLSYETIKPPTAKINMQPFVSYQSLPNPEKQTLSIETISKSQFNFLYVIGIGGFGKVWKVEHKRTGQVFAMKEMSKALVITKKSVGSVMNERQLLCELKHPFLVNMHYAFQDRDNLYLVMDYMLGGDLRYHIGRLRRLNEDNTKFFIACIFAGLEYLHGKNIIQRDIKPENLVMDEKGYVHITDMGIARLQRAENKEDTSGTPGYMAPEVMCRQNHTSAVDYFALGVIAYEFMLGRRPYVGRSRQEIREQILAKQVQIKKTEIPEGWSLESADFINKLIQRKPASRLGAGGSHEIKTHPWFKNFPWQKFQKKEVQPSFMPNPHDDNFDQKQIYIEDEENSELIQQNLMLLKDPAVQDLFIGYDYNPTRSETLTTSPSVDSCKLIRQTSRPN